MVGQQQHSSWFYKDSAYQPLILVCSLLIVQILVQPLISCFPESIMGQAIGKPASSPFQNSDLFSYLKQSSSSLPYFDQNAPFRPSIFSTLKKPPAAKPSDFIPLFNDCISAASSRTQEYLLFKDPEEKFHPSLEVLLQVGTSIVDKLKVRDCFIHVLLPTGLSDDIHLPEHQPQHDRRLQLHSHDS